MMLDRLVKAQIIKRTYFLDILLISLEIGSLSLCNLHNYVLSVLAIITMEC